MSGSRPLTTLSEEERTQAFTRFTVLQPYLEAGVPLRQLAQEHHIPVRTLQRWVQHYRQRGLGGLVRPQRADQGRRSMNVTLQQVVEGLALRRPAPSMTFVYRQATAIALQQGWPLPSYHSVYRLVRNLDPALVTLALQGTKVYGERMT